MSILESFIARVRLIKDNVITISWNNANNDLIGLKVAQESLELFERQTWAHYMNDLIKKIKLSSLCFIFLLSILISGLCSSYITLLSNY
jgi:hypothetical protein